MLTIFVPQEVPYEGAKLFIKAVIGGILPRGCINGRLSRGN